MKVLTVGHEYGLDFFESKVGDIYGYQTLQFIEKIPVEGSTELKTVRNGTTNEEVLAVLIDRLQYLDGEFPHDANKMALEHLLAALNHLNRRTAERKTRNVEGKAVL